MNEKKPLSTANFLAAVFLIILGVWIIAFSLKMPIEERYGIVWAAPAVAPIIFCALLVFCSLILLVQSILAKGHRFNLNKEKIKSFFTSHRTVKFFFAAALIFFAWFFLGKIHFVIVSSIYLFANFCFFEATVWWKSLFLSVLFSFVIWYSFENWFLIPLP